MKYLRTLFILPCVILFVTVSIGCDKKESTDYRNENTVSSATKEKSATNQQEQFEVYKSPTCGCCADWVDHMQAAGFSLNTHDLENLEPVKHSQGISRETASCHTAVSKEGYVFEGHVPAKFIKRFLKEKPADARGLSVPAMPVGTPGMEMGNKFMPYQVLSLKKDGTTEVYAQVNTIEEQY